MGTNMKPIFWPYWEGIMVEIEVGFRHASDEPSTIEHRLARANDLTYGCPPRHWNWSNTFPETR